MKQRAVQNKRYYHGDFRPATTAPEVDTRVHNYELLSYIKPKCGAEEGVWQ